MWGYKNKRGQRSPNKKRCQISPPKKEKKTKKREKERRGNVTILLPHLCLKVAPCSSYRESLELSLSYTSGNFHYRTWLVYSNDRLPQNCPRYSWASKLDAHPLSFLLSLHTLIALVHPLHGNPYSLTLISIDGHIHSPFIRLVDVRLSYPFLSSPQPPFYSTYSAMSMAHAHVLRESWKSLRTSKVWNNCLACHRGCAWF